MKGCKSIRMLRYVMAVAVVALMSITAVFAIDDTITLDYKNQALSITLDNGSVFYIDGKIVSQNSLYFITEADYGKTAEIRNSGTVKASAVLNRPSAPSDTGFTIDFFAETLAFQTDPVTSTIADMEYYFSDLSTPSAEPTYLSIDAATLKLEPKTKQTYCHIRTKATETAFPSAVRTLIIPSRPTTPAAAIDYTLEQFKNLSVDTAEYSNNDGEDYSDLTEIKIVPDVAGGVSTDYIFRIKATATTFASTPTGTITVSPRPEPLTSLTINYTKETVSTTTSMQYRYEGDTQYKTCSSATPLNPKNANETPNVLYVRKGPSSGNFASEDFALDVDNRPIAPDINDLLMDYFNEKITGFKVEGEDQNFSNYQFATTVDGSYTSPGSEVDIAKYKLFDTEMFIRTKAVEATTSNTKGQFASAAVSYKVPGRADQPSTDKLLSKFIDFDEEILGKLDNVDELFDYYNTSDKKWYPLKTKDDAENGDAAAKKGYINLTPILDKGKSSHTLRLAGNDGVGDDPPKFASSSFKVSLARPKAPKKTAYKTVFSETANMIDTQTGVLMSAEATVQLEYATYIKSSKTAGQFSEIPALGVSVGGAGCEIEQGKDHVVRYPADPSTESFASALYKFKIAAPKGAPKVSWVPLTEVYKGAKYDKMLYRVDDGEWKVYQQTDEVAADLAPNPTGGASKSVLFRLAGTDNKQSSSLTSATITIPARNPTPEFSSTGENGKISIDYNAEFVKGLSGMAYRVYTGEPNPRAKWKVVKSGIAQVKLAAFIPKKSATAVYEFIKVGSGMTANSAPLVITFNERQPQALIDDLMYNYATGVYSAGNTDLIVSADGKSWITLLTGEQTSVFAGKKVQFRLAPVPAVSADNTGKAKSGKSTKFNLMSAPQFSGSVFYTATTGTFSGIEGLEYATSSKGPWKSAETLTGKVADGKYFFRNPSTSEQPASKSISISAKYAPETE